MKHLVQHVSLFTTEAPLVPLAFYQGPDWPSSAYPLPTSNGIILGMAEASEKVEGVDGEKWSKWLVEDPEELKEIDNDKLRVEIRLLARHPFVDTRVLGDSYKRIDEMVRDGEVAIEDAAPWQIKISSRHEEINEIGPDGMTSAGSDRRDDRSAMKRLVDATEKTAERTEPSGYLARMQAEIRGMKKEGVPATEWAKLALVAIDRAERESEKDKLRSGENGEYWNVASLVIDEIPDGLGETDTTSELANYLKGKFTEGLGFKDRLGLLFTARKHLNDRFVEVSRAGGDLTKMGFGSGDVPFEGITYKVQFMNPEDDYILYHMDEIFPELNSLGPEAGELLPDVDKASCLWLDIGIKSKITPENLLTDDEKVLVTRISDALSNNRALIVQYYDARVDENNRRHENHQITDEFYEEINEELNKRQKNIRDTRMSLDFNWVRSDAIGDPFVELGIMPPDEVKAFVNIPNFENSLNDASLKQDLGSRIARYLKSKKAADLAFRNLTVKLTFEMLDRERKSTQGAGQPRDLMWIERKRVYEFGEKEREPGLDWTIGRYFVSDPHPEKKIKEKLAKLSKKMGKRREILAINAQRGILVEKRNHFEGEVVSDFFHNTMFFVPDRLSPGRSVRRNLASYIINADGSVREGGFRAMPFFQIGPESDTASGYWGYTLAKGQQLANEISSQTYKKLEEVVGVAGMEWWGKKRDLFARFEHISPRLITLEYNARGAEIRTILTDAGFKSEEVKKIAGYSEPSDLVGIIQNEAERQRATGVIESQGRTISSNARGYSEKARELIINKFRLVHALGVVWPGSIDAVKATSTILDSSIIPEGLLTDIIRTIEASRYLEGDYLDQFKIECREMGFGSIALGRAKRYTRLVNESLWD